jgi:tetratricopeptide (TPR) repeat protein
MLGLALVLIAAGVLGDRVAEPPSLFDIDLTAVPAADISGAEPLMQAALGSARDELDRLLAQPDPDRDELAAAYGRLGALLTLVEVEARADACFENAIALQPQELRWPYYAGYLAMLAGNLDVALAHFEQVRAIAPHYAPLYLRLGKVHLDRSALGEARQALTRAAAEPSLAGPANYYLGQIAVLERRFADAVPLLEAALDATPDATEVHYPLAQAYRALGEDERARAHLAEFRERAPRVQDPLIAELEAVSDRALPAFKEAVYAVRGGDYATAVRRFADGLAVVPDNAAARVSYARVLWLTGDQERAEAELRRALAQAPEEPLAVFLVGVVAEQRGESEQATARYRQVLALEPAHAGALFQRANLDFRAGRWAAAAEGYRQALAADAGVTPARVLAQVAALRAGAPERDILARLRALADAHPDDAQLRYAMARLLAGAQTPSLRDPDAARELAAALLADPTAGGPIPPHQRALALARAAGGDFDGAVALLRPMEAAAWMLPPAEATLVGAELAAFTDGRLPAAWPPGDSLLEPPPFNAAQLMRDYPAIRPY